MAGTREGGGAGAELSPRSAENRNVGYVGRVGEISLLQGDENFYGAGAGVKIGEGLADDGADHARAVGGFHCVAEGARGYEEITAMDRAVFGRDFTGDDTDDCEGNLGFRLRDVLRML